MRGYGYQAIGPQDSSGDPVGGKSLAEFSVEARVRFGAFWSVPFFDAGNDATGFLPRLNALRRRSVDALLFDLRADPHLTPARR